MGFSEFESKENMSPLEIFQNGLKKLITDDSIKTAFTNLEQTKESEKTNLTELLIILSVEQAKQNAPQNRMVEYAVAALMCHITPIIRKGIVDRNLIIFRNNDTIYNDIIIETQQYPKIPLFVSKKDFIKWQEKEKSIYVSETLKQLLTNEMTESSAGSSNTDWINARKADLMGMARVLALHFWHNDEKMRMAEMAKKVYDELGKYTQTPVLPKYADTIKDWIKPVAPEYASRRGRPSKNKK